MELLDLTGIKEILARTKANTVSRIASRRKSFLIDLWCIARSAKGESEIRFAALGKTYGSRLLTVVFTLRARKIRVISARPMSRSERKLYEEEN